MCEAICKWIQWMCSQEHRSQCFQKYQIRPSRTRYLSTLSWVLILWYIFKNICIIYLTLKVYFSREITCFFNLKNIYGSICKNHLKMTVSLKHTEEENILRIKFDNKGLKIDFCYIRISLQIFERHYVRNVGLSL